MNVKKVNLASIGSSFAAGPGIAPQVEPRAGRSAENYAHILARKLGSQLTDLSVSGATLLNLLDEPQAVRGTIFPPQIDGIPEDTDVVLILGGGNDMGYIGGLFVDSFKAYAAFRAIAGLYSWIAGTAAEGAPAGLSVEALAERYGTVLDAVHAKAPKAQVVVVEYLSLLGPDVKAGVHVPFDASLLESHRAKAAQVLKGTSMAIQGREEWCAVVSVAEPSLAHGLGSPEPWVNGFGVKELYMFNGYHPNGQGMSAVADMIVLKLQELGCLSNSMS